MIDGDINIVIAAFCLKCVCAHWGVEVVWQASTHIGACCQRKNEVKSVVNAKLVCIDNGGRRTPETSESL